MQETTEMIETGVGNEINVPVKKPSALRESLQGARLALQTDECHLAIVITYLFCVTALFALAFAVAPISFFWVPTTYGGMLLYVAVITLFAVSAFCFLLLPLFAGYARIAGMIAMGASPEKSELFHYFSSWRLWRRGMRIALIWPLVLLWPPLFGAPAVAMGNEALPIRRALSLSHGRVPFSVVLAFWGRVLVRFLLGVLTLGVLWLLYDAHHLTVTYFALCTREQNIEGEEEIAV